MITLTHTKQITEQISNMIAQRFGYQVFLYDKSESGGHQNPQSEADFVNEKYQEHCNSFFKEAEEQIIKQMVAEQVAILETQARAHLSISIVEKAEEK
jgi:hypothetical protein